MTSIKKIFILILFSIAFSSVHAQFTNSKWTTTLQLDSPVDVLFDFKTDTLEVFSLPDSSSLETMLYSVKDNVLTLQKIYGQSQCDSTAAKYKFEIKDDQIIFELVEDGCDDRSNVLDKNQLTRVR
jgi:hypothetical protein